MRSTVEIDIFNHGQRASGRVVGLVGIVEGRVLCLRFVLGCPALSLLQCLRLLLVVICLRSVPQLIDGFLRLQARELCRSRPVFRRFGRFWPHEEPPLTQEAPSHGL
jgi:hypothetical protein